MTTIAIRDGVGAFDSRLTEGEVITYGAQKAWISSRHPVVLASVGTFVDCHTTIRVLESARRSSVSLNFGFRPFAD